jgi:hypothetical protein
MGQRLRAKEKEKAQRRVYEAWKQQQQMEREEHIRLIADQEHER